MKRIRGPDRVWPGRFGATKSVFPSEHLRRTHRFSFKSMHWASVVAGVQVDPSSDFRSTLGHSSGAPPPDAPKVTQGDRDTFEQLQRNPQMLTEEVARRISENPSLMRPYSRIPPMDWALVSNKMFTRTSVSDTSVLKKWTSWSTSAR